MRLAPASDRHRFLRRWTGSPGGMRTLPLHHRLLRRRHRSKACAAPETPAACPKRWSQLSTRPLRSPQDTLNGMRYHVALRSTHLVLQHGCTPELREHPFSDARCRTEELRVIESFRERQAVRVFAHILAVRVELLAEIRDDRVLHRGVARRSSCC